MVTNRRGFIDPELITRIAPTRIALPSGQSFTGLRWILPLEIRRPTCSQQSSYVPGAAFHFHVSREFRTNHTIAIPYPVRNTKDRRSSNSYRWMPLLVEPGSGLWAKGGVSIPIAHEWEIPAFPFGCLSQGVSDSTKYGISLREKGSFLRPTSRTICLILLILSPSISSF